MPVYELDFNVCDSNEYLLIGIHTTLNDYKLAYLLNGILNSLFKKASYCLDIKIKNDVKTSFSVYEYLNLKSDHNWFLINNVSKHKIKSEEIGLFAENTVINYLVPEKKKVDYFIKIEGDFDYTFIENAVQKIKQIPQVITSYQIEVDTLKSKDFLIF